MKNEEDILVNDIKLIKNNLKKNKKEKIIKLREIKNWAKNMNDMEVESVVIEFESPLKNKFSPNTNNLYEFFKMNKMEICSPLGVKQFNCMQSDINDLVDEQNNPVELKEKMKDSRSDIENKKLIIKSRGNYLK